MTSASLNGPTSRRLAAALVGALIISQVAAGNSEASEPRLISSVFVSRAFFNPTLGQKVEISFFVSRSGLLTLSLLDANGGLVRRLVSREAVEPGKLSYVWDGRDAKGAVVPDQAYSLRIDLARSGEKESYFPASRKPGEVKTETTFYDRQNGILAYELSAPSRVRIQARSSRISRTIVSDQPRTEGSVIDYWNGFDDSGKLYLPALPDFSISISANALPENAIITVGNRAASGPAASRREKQQ